MPPPPVPTPAPDAPIRIGMVGVGRFGTHRRKTLRQAGRFDLVACCDRDPAALQEACEEERARPFDSMDRMLGAADLEAIMVSTGADSHASLALQAMNAGKHVFIEKPLCSTLEEVGALRETQRRTGAVVGLGHAHVDLVPSVRLVRTLGETGRLGTLVCYEENSSHSGGLEFRRDEWRATRARNPGGMLFQCGVHALHGLVHLFGPVRSLSAMMRYDANPATETADAACVLLRHTSGMIGTLNCYHVTAYCHEFRIFGTRGNAYIDTFTGAADFQPRKRGGIENREPVELDPLADDAPVRNLLEWARAIRTGTDPSPSLDDGMNAVLPVFAAQRAADERREVLLEELGPPQVRGLSEKA